MKALRILFFLFISTTLPAQKVSTKPGNKIPAGDSAISQTQLNNDSLLLASGEIPEGVIYVRKPHITPYVKVDYSLFLVQIRKSKVLVPRGDNIPAEEKEVAVYDSAAFPKSLKRAYPLKAEQFSKYFAENLQYLYQPSDTPRVDTMIIGMAILANGKVKYVEPDTTYTGEMPQELVDQIAQLGDTISSWGNGGGYMTKKKFLKPSKLVKADYYCEIYVIVSSYPLTEDQKRSGKSYALFDYPLNSPPIDAEQGDSITRNKTEHVPVQKK